MSLTYDQITNGGTYNRAEFIKCIEEAGFVYNGVSYWRGIESWYVGVDHADYRPQAYGYRTMTVTLEDK